MDLLQQKLQLNSIDEVITYILDKLNQFGFKARKIVKNIHFACPIQGSQIGKLIQVDFFNSVDLQYTKMQKFSPSQQESKYKGLHRTQLWRAIMKSVSIKAFDNINEDFIAPDGRHYPSKNFKHLLMMADGFYTTYKSWLGKNQKILKNTKKDVKPREFLGRDFQQILDMLFGKGTFNTKDLLSFETIWNNILFSDKFPYKNRIKDIVTTFYYECIKKDVIVPKEVQEYIKNNGLEY